MIGKRSFGKIIGFKVVQLEKFTFVYFLKFSQIFIFCFNWTLKILLNSIIRGKRIKIQGRNCQQHNINLCFNNIGISNIYIKQNSKQIEKRVLL